MGVTTTNLIQGPATIYLGTFGATEPATVAAVPGAPFTDLGGTSGGVELNIADDYSVMEIDQVIYELGRRRTKRVVTVATSLAEATLANLALALNNTAPTANVLTGDDGLTAFAPAYSALIIDGIAPGGFKRRITLRKVLATEAVGVAYKKDEQTLVPVTWSLHWVSSSIAPFKVEDATS